MLQKVPFLGGVFAFTAIASLGLPGLAGFWGEVMALLSSYNPASRYVTLFRTLMVFGGIGTVLTAGYFLWMLQRVNLGNIPDSWRERTVPDITGVEWLAWAPLLIGIFALGLFPRLVFGVTNEAVAALARIFGG